MTVVPLRHVRAPNVRNLVLHELSPGVMTASIADSMVLLGERDQVAQALRLVCAASAGKPAAVAADPRCQALAAQLDELERAVDGSAR